MIASEICNRADDLKLSLEIARNKIDWARLLAVDSEEELAKILEVVDDRLRGSLLHKPGMLRQIIMDKKFPTLNRDAQEQFLADSLAALGQVSIRRSRDIIQENRSALNKQGTILRREFYIECSCGYTGPALNDACPRCRAEVPYLDFASGFTLRGLNDPNSVD